MKRNITVIQNTAKFYISFAFVTHFKFLGEEILCYRNCRTMEISLDKE